MVGWVLGRSGEGRVMGECLVGQWIVGEMILKKIYGLKHHMVEKR